MILDRCDFSDPRIHLHLERYVNRGSPSGFSSIHTTSTQTSSKGRATGFHLCAARIPSSVNMIEYGERPAFLADSITLIHPDMVSDPMFSVCESIDRQFAFVAPTSSERTVKTLDANGWYYKLSYKGLIGRMERQLGCLQADSAVEVTDLITQAIRDEALSKEFHFLREPYGRVFQLPLADGTTYDWGFVVREPAPFPYRAAPSLLIPAFSLFSIDEFAPTDPPLLAQLFARQSKSMEDFLFDDLIRPLYDAYFSLLLTCGLQLEAHAQNILYLVDESFRITGVVARDAESIDKDVGLAEDLRLSVRFKPTTWKRLLREQYNYHIMHSFMFDFKMGEYVTSPLIEAGQRIAAFDKIKLERQIAAHSRAYINRLPDDFFPSDGGWYSYANIVHERGAKRSYINNGTPKYR